MDILMLENNEDYNLVLDVMLQLRPSFTRQSLAEQITRQYQQGYKVVYLKSQGIVIAVAGFNVGEKLAWGKYVYIDDLVTNEHHRSTGAGKAILDWFKSYCRKNGCNQLHLDSGVQRFSAHKFYLREGFNIASHHFSLTNIE